MDPIHLNIEHLCCPIIPSVHQVRNCLSFPLFLSVHLRSIVRFDITILLQWNILVACGEVCIRIFGILWIFWAFCSILRRSPKKAARPPYTFLFRFRIRVLHALHLPASSCAELNSFACCSCDKSSTERFTISRTTVILANLPIRRNRMHYVQATSFSLMLYPRALILTFSLSSPSPFCSNDSRTLSALRETVHERFTTDAKCFDSKE